MSRVGTRHLYFDYANYVTLNLFYKQRRHPLKHLKLSWSLLSHCLISSRKFGPFLHVLRGFYLFSPQKFDYFCYNQKKNIILSIKKG